MACVLRHQTLESVPQVMETVPEAMFPEVSGLTGGARRRWTALASFVAPSLRVAPSLLESEREGLERLESQREEGMEGGGGQVTIHLFAPFLLEESSLPESESVFSSRERENLLS